MNDQELSPVPEPRSEPAELAPGGVDAIGEPELPPLGHDLAPHDNAALDDDEPDELTEPEGSTQEPTSDGATQPELETTP